MNGQAGSGAAQRTGAESFDMLLDRSSLGADSAWSLRNRTTPEQAERIVRRSTRLQVTHTDSAWADLTGPDRHAACVSAACAGNRMAINTLVAELTPLVWHVTRSYGLDRVAAEDVVQTVWLALLGNLRTLAEPKALAKWLITTTRREALRVKTRVGVNVPLSDELAEQIESTQPQPEAEAVRADRDRRLWRLFADLPRECQELLRLTVLNGRVEYQTVVETLGMPRGSIGPKRRRCLNAMRELLEGRGGVD